MKHGKYRSNKRAAKNLLTEYNQCHVSVSMVTSYERYAGGKRMTLLFATSNNRNKMQHIPMLRWVAAFGKKRYL